VFGVDVAAEPHRVRQLLGVTGQYASVDEDLTAAENLWLFGRLQGLRSAEARATARRLLGQFSLQNAADKPLAQFSGGMRRRLDLAVSLIARPPLIFLDGLPAPLRILCRLTGGNRQPCHPAAPVLTAMSSCSCRWRGTASDRMAGWNSASRLLAFDLHSLGP
jgi:hypothetical protein